MLLRACVVFCLGVTLAILVSYHGLAREVFTYFAWNQVTPPKNAPSEKQAAARARLEEAPQTANVLANSAIKESPSPASDLTQAQLPAPAVSRVELSDLLQALQLATSQSLQQLREEELKKLPDYPLVILPALKSEALEKLLKSFTRIDWEDWFRSSRIQPTPARLFIDNISFVHPTLGIFLESSAQILHGLFLNTEAGKQFNQTEYLQGIIKNAEEVTRFRRQRAIPARLLFSTEVLQDPVFISVLERERGRLIAAYIMVRPDEIQTNLELVHDVDAAYAPEQLFSVLEQSLADLVTRASSGVRREVLEEELERRKFENFGNFHPGVRRALAQLFAVGAIDALEEGDTRSATFYLRESLGIQSGLQSQSLVGKLLAEETLRNYRTRDTERSAGQRPSILRYKYLPKSQSVSEKTEGFAFGAYVLVIFIVLGGFGALYLVKRLSQRSDKFLIPEVQLPDIDLPKKEEESFDVDNIVPIRPVEEAQVPTALRQNGKERRNRERWQPQH